MPRIELTRYCSYLRAMLYEAAHIMLVRSAKWSWLKAWAMKIARHRGLKKAVVALARRLAVIMHRSGLTAPSPHGPGKPQQHDNRAGSNSIGGHSSSTERWNDVPRGTTDEVRSHVRLDLSSVGRQGRPLDCSTSSSNLIMEGPCADSEEKREPAGDIATVVVDGPKVLDPNGRLEKRTSRSQAT